MTHERERMKSKWPLAAAGLCLMLGMLGSSGIWAPFGARTDRTIALAAPNAPEAQLVNGDFESGAGVGWTEYSKLGFPVIVPASELPLGVSPHAGTWAAWLGGEVGEQAYIEQSVTIAGGTPVLGYWHWIESTASCGRDYGRVLVDGVVVSSYSLCIATNTGGWVKWTVDLSAYIGQMVTLRIALVTSASRYTNLYLDDAALEGGTGSTATPTSTPSRTATVTQTPTATLTRTATATPTSTATRTPTNTATSTGTATNTATATPSSTPTASRTPTSSATASPTGTATSTPTSSPSATASPTATATSTRTATASPTTTPTASRTATATPSPTPTSTPAATATRTPTATPSSSPTETASPTATATSAGTAAASATATPTGTPTASRTPTNTPTETATSTSTASPDGGMQRRIHVPLVMR